MKLLVALALFSILSIAVVSGKVVDLTPDNFDSVVDGSKHVLVEFFAPWCGHCKKLAPEYDMAGEAFAKQDNVVIAKVDADEHSSLGTRFEVQGFPTLKYFPKGSTTPQDYEGGRTAEDIVTFMNEKSGAHAKIKKAPSNVVDLTTANFDSIVLDKTKDVLVEFYAPWCGHCKNLAPDYEKVANAFANEPNVVVAKVDADAQKSLGSRYGVSGFPTLKWFGKNDKEEPITYEKGRDVQSFVDYINEKAGTHRVVSGRLSDEAGRVEALDAIAQKFMEKGADLDALLKQAEAVVSGLSGSQEKSGKIYLKIMQTVQSKGPSYIQTEAERLDRMLDGSVSAKKADEFSIRQNILEAFELD